MSSRFCLNDNEHLWTWTHFCHWLLWTNICGNHGNVADAYAISHLQCLVPADKSDKSKNTVCLAANSTLKLPVPRQPDTIRWNSQHQGEIKNASVTPGVQLKAKNGASTSCSSQVCCEITLNKRGRHRPPFQQADLCLPAPLAPFFFLIICRCERNQRRAQLDTERVL